MPKEECYFCGKGGEHSAGLCSKCRANKIHKKYRKCKPCNTVHPLTEKFFNKGHKSNGGFNHYCKNCRPNIESSRLMTGVCIDCSGTCQSLSTRCKKCNMAWKNARERNPMWRGGKSYCHGYLLIRCNNEYYPEHRLVMENYLGRELTKKEVVHHKNGIKDDNRIENLELCLKSKHPPGQRVPELYKWAKELIRTYENDMKKLEKVVYTE